MRSFGYEIVLEVWVGSEGSCPTDSTIAMVISNLNAPVQTSSRVVYGLSEPTYSPILVSGVERDLGDIVYHH